MFQNNVVLIALNFYNRTAKIFWPYCNNLSDEYKEREKNNLLLSWQDKILLSCLSLSVLSKFSMRKDKHWFNSWAHLEPYLQVNYFFFATRFFFIIAKKKVFREADGSGIFKELWKNSKEIPMSIKIPRKSLGILITREFLGTQFWLIFVSKAKKISNFNMKFIFGK